MNAIARSKLKTFLYTGLFCLGIGITNWAVDPRVLLWPSLMISFCIGWSINLSFFTLDKFIHQHLGPYFAPIPLTAIGLVFGLLLGGTLVLSEPLFFFTESYFTLVTGVFFGIVGFLLFNTRGRLLQAQADLAAAREAQANQTKLLTETKLKLLQAQIEPHFLFNTLSNIASLIHQDPLTAEKTLLHLTTLLRATLDRTRRETTTLAQELEFAAAYLEIQATRMQGRLTYNIVSTSAPDDMHLPPLIIQPIIENAIKHGIEPNEAGGHIEVAVAQEGGDLIITVQDNGLGFPTHGDNPTAGTGLSNVRDRLKTLFETASLTLEEPAAGGVAATLRIPLHAGEHLNAG